MHIIKCSVGVISVFVLVLLGVCAVQADTKEDPDTVGVTPDQAFELRQKDPGNTVLIDVRTRPEYVLIGHPEGAYNIPFVFWTEVFNGSRYGLNKNTNFGKDLQARFNPATHRLLMICRSGARSAMAYKIARKAGWPPDRVFNVLEGFEGGKVKNKNSAFYGQRKKGGWRNRGLPWTYRVDPNLVYQPDVIRK